MFIKLENNIVNKEMIKSFDENRIWFGGNDTLNLIGDDYKKLLASVLPKEHIEKSNEPKSELLELFEELHKLTGGTGKVVFTLGREKKLHELMTKHRLTKENLITAATNIGQDAFLQGDNDSRKRYGDVDYLLRPDKAAKWSNELIQKKKGMF